MYPTPHHKTAYVSSPASWLKRHMDLFKEVGKELGFECTAFADIISFSHSKMDLDFQVFFYDKMRIIKVIGNFIEGEINTYKKWRGEDKPASHNDGKLGNWFILLIRKAWVDKNRPKRWELSLGDEILFSSNPASGAERTRAIIDWVDTPSNNFLVVSQEQRGVNPPFTEISIKYEHIICKMVSSS